MLVAKLKGWHFEELYFHDILEKTNEKDGEQIIAKLGYNLMKFMGDGTLPCDDYGNGHTL